jgi:hypothetical protein
MREIRAGRRSSDVFCNTDTADAQPNRITIIHVLIDSMANLLRSDKDITNIWEPQLAIREM